MSSSDYISGGNIAVSIVSVITGGVVIIVVSLLIYKCYKLRMMRNYGAELPPMLPLVETRSAAAVPARPIGSSSSSSYGGTVDVVKDRPVRFSSSQLQEFTGNYAERLGAGGFGVVFRGQIQLPGDDGSRLEVAVKVLGSNMGRRAEELCTSLACTIGRTSHVNLVRLYGFCFDAQVKALVYEFMPNGSLDNLLFNGGGGRKLLGFDKLYDIAVGTAKAVRYLHDECERRIIHYDIKPGNVLLDAAFCPKVADFGLATLCERERTHVTMTGGGGGGRGTPGYAAPELWIMAAPATHKCDVYSYGMLLFEILGRRRNYVDVVEATAGSAERWYPRWVWQRLERGEMEALVARALVADHDRAAGNDRRNKVERMCAVALWCVQYRPEDRPSMSSVVRMLEGDEDVTAPAVNPFAHLDANLRVASRSFTADTTTAFGSASFQGYPKQHLQ